MVELVLPELLTNHKIMSKTVIIVIVVLIVLGAFYFWAPDSWKWWQKTTTEKTNGDVLGTVSPHERITAKHQFKNGTHIIAGETNLPTPCHILNTTARVAESFPEQVTIDFTSTSSGEICAQVITVNRFKIEFQASENAMIKATWNGQPVELNLIPSGATEDLTNFEIFIKG